MAMESAMEASAKWLETISLRSSKIELRQMRISQRNIDPDASYRCDPGWLSYRCDPVRKALVRCDEEDWMKGHEEEYPEKSHRHPEVRHRDNEGYSVRQLLQSHIPEIGVEVKVKDSEVTAALANEALLVFC